MNNDSKTTNHSIRHGSNRSQTDHEIPVSLGKPSLRRRLEAYYRQVAPSHIANHEEWRSKVDQIYDKYGGSYQGEAKLARHLYRKYGSRVTFAQVQQSSQSAETAATLATNDGKQQDESWYQTKMQQFNDRSGVLDMTHPSMDAVALLRASNSLVLQHNPWLDPSSMATTTTTTSTSTSSLATSTTNVLLDRVALFAPYLPVCDPLARPSTGGVSRKRPRTDPATTATTTTASNSQKQKSSFHVPRCFAEIAQAVVTSANYQCYRKKQSRRTSSSNPNNNSNKKENPMDANDDPATTAKASTNHKDDDMLQDGPMGLLYRAMQERFQVCIVIRHGKHGVRGTLTGFVMALDKHWNLILQNVQELYSCQPSHDETDKDANNKIDWKESPIEREIQRRQCRPSIVEAQGSSTTRHSLFVHKRRYMPQILVRGDTIVLVYRASAEQSVVTQTSLQSRYPPRRKHSKSTTLSSTDSIPAELRNERTIVGTPGTCTCPPPLRAKSRHYKKQRRR